MVSNRGATLVELMVAVTIGLLVTLVVSQAYLAGSSTQSAQSGLTRLQESGRFGLLLLSNEIAKAGFRDTSPIPPNFPGRNFGPNGTASLNGTLLNLIDGSDGGPSDPVNSTFPSDAIRVSFYGENDPTVTTDTPDGRVLDCLGNAVSRDTLVIETLSIAKDPANNNEPSLACQVVYVAGAGGAPGCAGGATCGVGSSPVPLIPGVESMQVLYGVDSDRDGVANYFVPAGALLSSDWPNVVGVRVSLVVRSPSAGGGNPTAAATVWNHFGSSAYAPGNIAPTNDAGSVYTAPADGRFRLMFSSAVALRNYEF